jgi:hypothetical protein
MEYYIRLRGEQQGPFPEEQLQKLAARGRFGRHYEVSTDSVNWSRAENYPDLFPRPPVPVSRQKSRAEATNELSLAAPAASPNAGDEPQVEWFYTHDSAEMGPLAAPQMFRAIELGQVQPDDFVWSEGMNGWRKLQDVPELARLLKGVHEAASSGGGGIKMAPMAVASFVLGVVGMTVLPFLGSVLAVVFGHVALRQVHASQGKQGGKGLAIAGLIMGYLVIIPGVIFFIVFVAIIALAPSGTAVG